MAAHEAIMTMKSLVEHEKARLEHDFGGLQPSRVGETEGETESETPVFLAAQPKAEGHKVANILLHGHPTRVDATFPDDLLKQTWQQRLSMFLVKFLWITYPLLKTIGFLFEWTINLFVLNHGPLRLLFRILLPFKWNSIVVPSSEADNYLSVVGQLDPRRELYVDKSEAAKAHSKRADAIVFPDENVGSRVTADVCVMAAKLSYENEAVIKRVVQKHWGMHFVKFYSCWNDYQQMNNTQAFIMMDKRSNANAVVVAFRGTEAFNAYDWSTDVDFSWVKLAGLGGVHLGFLEALGLATREDPATFTKLRNQAKHAGHESRKHGHKTEDDIQKAGAISGLADQVIHSRGKVLAYDAITYRIGMLLLHNPKAKLFITGHSLGGALSVLYATMLFYTGQTEIADKIGAVYTFGQPRVGDEDFAKYGEEKLKSKYFRVVYCNDMVPRVPFDNGLFAFKHFGGCVYFNSAYDGLTLRDQPNPNFFGVGRLLTMHLNALWEIFQGLVLITLQYGHEFSETAACLSFRAIGLLLPGVSAHSPCNYVNSMRLGPTPLSAVRSDQIADLAQEIRLVQDNVKDILHIMYSEFWKFLGRTHKSTA